MAAGILAVNLAGCDAVRYPGDGGEPPRTPDTLDPDAPPPPPPSVPVTDPYGTGDTGETDDPTEDVDTPVSDTADDPVDVSDQTPDTDTPVADTPTEEDPVVPEEPVEEPDPVFSFYAPGQLIPGSGTGSPDQLVHAPDIVFPVRTAPAYLQSQVWNYGGGIGGGDECDSRNFAYPWRDNFCETRTSNRNSPYCPVSKIHQGQDIRVGTPRECEIMRSTAEDDRMLHEVVAVEDGTVYEIGSYTVKLRSGGRIYRYMHMNMDALQVAAGDVVEAGDVLGYVSKDFGGSATTFHLHFEIIQNTDEHGWVHVPPYMSLVEAYERREEGPGEVIEQTVSTASAPRFPPEGMEIIE